MKRGLGIILISCMLFLTGCNGNVFHTASAASLYQKGCEAYDKGDYTEATEAFKEAVKKDTAGELLVYSYSYLGHCMAEQGDYETAKKYYETALSTGNEAAMCYTNLGVLYRKTNDFTAAEQSYLLALKADGTYTDAMTSLGVLYSMMGQAQKAVEFSERAVTASENPPAHYDANLAYAYALAGRFKEANDRLTAAKAKGYPQEEYAAVLGYIEEWEKAASEEKDSPETDNNDILQEEHNDAVTGVPTTAPSPTPTTAISPTSVPEIAKEKVIAIDPGHQVKGNYEKEPEGPGAAEMKTKVSTGTQGGTTKVPEHQFNLELSLKLRDALTEGGYRVVMTRETAEVDISNAERAELANAADADIYIRIHADGAENPAANGISVLYPSEQNPYVAELSPDSKRLAQAVLDGMCEETGAKKRGIVERDDLTGINWAKMPVIVVEAGFMTNEAEEKKLVSAQYQALLVQGIVEGIQEYFQE